MSQGGCTDTIWMNLFFLSLFKIYDYMRTLNLLLTTLRIVPSASDPAHWNLHCILEGRIPSEKGTLRLAAAHPAGRDSAPRVTLDRLWWILFFWQFLKLDRKIPLKNCAGVFVFPYHRVFCFLVFVFWALRVPPQRRRSFLTATISTYTSELLGNLIR